MYTALWNRTFEMHKAVTFESHKKIISVALFTHSSIGQWTVCSVIALLWPGSYGLRTRESLWSSDTTRGAANQGNSWIKAPVLVGPWVDGTGPRIDPRMTGIVSTMQWRIELQRQDLLGFLSTLHQHRSIHL